MVIELFSIEDALLYKNMAVARFSSDVIKRMAESGDLIDFNEPIIESGDTKYREEDEMLSRRG